MNDLKYIKLREQPGLAEKAAKWFHEKWGIPEAAYRQRIDECISGKSLLQWYVVTDGERIAAGLGVIENDFHNRKDLTPNVCAVYVEKEYRCHGIAGKMLELVCKDMSQLGFDTLYLVTDHTSFYERYGWEFYCMVKEDGDEGNMSRLYIHRA